MLSRCNFPQFPFFFDAVTQKSVSARKISVVIVFPLRLRFRFGQRPVRTRNRIIACIIIPAATFPYFDPFLFHSAVFDAFEISAARERIRVYARYAIGDSYAFKTNASCKRIVAYACDSVSDYYAF